MLLSAARIPMGLLLFLVATETVAVTLHRLGKQEVSCKKKAAGKEANERGTSYRSLEQDPARTEPSRLEASRPLNDTSFS
jgi:hypothetical protein